MAQIPHQMPAHQQGQPAGYHMMPAQQQQGQAAGYHVAPTAEARGLTRHAAAGGGGQPSSADLCGVQQESAARWQYVGEGRGGYQQAPNYHYVGFGQGNFEKQTVVTHNGWQVRKGCIVCMWTVPVALLIVWALLAIRPAAVDPGGGTLPATNHTTVPVGAGFVTGGTGLPNGTGPGLNTLGTVLTNITGLNISELDHPDLVSRIGSDPNILAVGSGNATVEELLNGMELYDCEQKPMANWSMGKAIWCCGHHKKGCTEDNASLADNASQADVKVNATEEKLATANLSNASATSTTEGPTTTTTTEHYDCTNMEETTPLRTRVWCCLHEKVACPKQGAQPEPAC